MKKIAFLTILITLLILTVSFSFAQALEEDESTTTTTSSSDQLDELKEKIASKVAELKLTEKRGITGTVTDTSNTQVTILDLEGNQRFIDIDELTKFYSSSNDDFGVSDIEEGDAIGVLGIYNKQSRRILAREINTITIPKFVNGIVISVNEDYYTLDIATNSNKKITADVERITKTFSYNDESGLSKSGFSKVEKNVNILLVGYQDKTDKNRITASRIILLPEIPENPHIDVSQIIKNNEDITPSTGSGKKLTPITN